MLFCIDLVSIVLRKLKTIKSLNKEWEGGVPLFVTLGIKLYVNIFSVTQEEGVKFMSSWHDVI